MKPLNLRAHYTLARLYVPDEIEAGAPIELAAAQGHYLTTVLRKKTQDDVRIFNAGQGEWRASIIQASRKQVILEPLEQLRGAYTPPPLTLFFAPVKKARTDFIIEKATELGVTDIHPVITARTQFPKLRLDRARAQIIEAAEQTERVDIPAIHNPAPLMETVTAYTGTILFADEAGDAKSALAALQAVSDNPAILIGPEGGFSPQEREQLKALPSVTPVSLGPRILRADTAALSMLTLWQASKGDWTQGP